MAHFFTEEAADLALKRKSRLITCERALRARGIAFVEVLGLDLGELAVEYAQASPQSIFLEDGEFAQYRNVLEEPTFPFDAIFAYLAPVFSSQFGRSPDSVRLDDAFVIHYNTTHADTTVKKHTDPSDITVNLCLDQSTDLRGSDIVFYGTKCLLGSDKPCTRNYRECDCRQTHHDAAFRVATRTRCAMLHYGAHPHETLPLEAGARTNCILTYRFAES